MTTIASFFIDIDVSATVLTQSGREIVFDLSKNRCAENETIQDFQFALVRASYCNGALLPPPLVTFKQLENGRVSMIIDTPTDVPELVDCARVSIRIEYWPRNDNKRFCV